MALVGRDAPIMRLRPQSPSREAGKLPASEMYSTGAVTIAWAIGGSILLSSTFFYRVLRERGLIAIERLMGMLLVMVSVQMLVNGLKTLLRGPA